MRSITNKKVEERDSIWACDLNYGEACKYKGYYYIKLNKQNIGTGIHIDFPSRHCILFNIKTGSTRAVKFDEYVEPIIIDVSWEKPNNVRDFNSMLKPEKR